MAHDDVVCDQTTKRPGTKAVWLLFTISFITGWSLLVNIFEMILYKTVQQQIVQNSPTEEGFLTP
uniref:Putative ovule protein n=1 Tax=Solanum chacoense TaxID=4108 RepID=A0A0V0GQM6_SOLCH